MVLVLFDVDGTLTESSALDDEAFLDAIRETFGFRGISDDWASYRHVTGAGVLQEIVEMHLGRPPTEEEAGRMQARLHGSLHAGIQRSEGIRSVPGAAQILARLRASPGEYAAALASGNWEANVRLMLDSAGVRAEGIPGAFSDDDHTREGICQASRRRAEEQLGHPLPTVVYIGDGVWDVQTSRTLGYGFVGIGRDAGAAKLHAAGAVEVLPDYADAEAFLAAVRRAASTLPPASSQFAGTTVSAH